MATHTALPHRFLYDYRVEGGPPRWWSASRCSHGDYEFLVLYLEDPAQGVIDDHERAAITMCIMRALPNIAITFGPDRLVVRCPARRFMSALLVAIGGAYQPADDGTLPTSFAGCVINVLEPGHADYRQPLIVNVRCYQVGEVPVLELRLDAPSLPSARHLLETGQFGRALPDCLATASAVSLTLEPVPGSPDPPTDALGYLPAAWLVLGTLERLLIRRGSDRIVVLDVT